MEKDKDLEMKFQKLSNDYSKLRVQAQVLKKGVLDEQSKSNDLREEVKDYEQRLRKAYLEMESLNFRNSQLTKRIGVLQEDLNRQEKTPIRSGKKPDESVRAAVLDEELTAKIIENANLLVEKNEQAVEISLLKDKVEQLEAALKNTQTQTKREDVVETRRARKPNKPDDRVSIDSFSSNQTDSAIEKPDDKVQTNYLEQIEHHRRIIVELRGEIEMLRAQLAVDNAKENGDASESDVIREQRITEYFLERINSLVKENDLTTSMYNDLQLECHALEVRVELSLKEKTSLETKLLAAQEVLMQLQEELSTTCHNYESQLSTMSDHLANMNETLTNQTDQIQHLTYELRNKK